MILASSIKQQGLKLRIGCCRKRHHIVDSLGLTENLRLGLGVLQDFNQLRPDTQLKNITAWTPVVAEMLQGFVKLDDKAVSIFIVSRWILV
jgi:hypothetical protein